MMGALPIQLSDIGNISKIPYICILTYNTTIHLVMQKEDEYYNTHFIDRELTDSKA
jgi:hypothetical protein